jgi:hypothetical protein
MNTETYETEYELPADWQTSPRQPNRKRKYSIHFMVDYVEHARIMTYAKASKTTNLRDYFFKLIYSANVTRKEMSAICRCDRTLYELSNSLKEIEQRVSESGNISGEDLSVLHAKFDRLTDFWHKTLSDVRKDIDYPLF